MSKSWHMRHYKDLNPETYDVLWDGARCALDGMMQVCKVMEDIRMFGNSSKDKNTIQGWQTLYNELIQSQSELIHYLHIWEQQKTKNTHIDTKLYTQRFEFGPHEAQKDQNKK